jgi:hypothetical protein
VDLTRPEFTVEAGTDMSVDVETNVMNATVAITSPADVTIPVTKVYVPGIGKKTIKSIKYVSDGTVHEITNFKVEADYLTVTETLDIKKTQ